MNITSIGHHPRDLRSNSLTLAIKIISGDFLQTQHRYWSNSGTESSTWRGLISVSRDGTISPRYSAPLEIESRPERSLVNLVIFNILLILFFKLKLRNSWSTLVTEVTSDFTYNSDVTEQHFICLVYLSYGFTISLFKRSGTVNFPTGWDIYII